MTERIDPEAWLRERGWTRYESKMGIYWRRTPNEPGWEGGWNTAGAVHMELDADKQRVLERMGLWQPLTRRRGR